MDNPHKGRTGLRRVLFAARHSAAGLAAAWRHESAFRQEALLAALMVPTAAWLGTNWVERSLLIGCVVLVLITELLNSGIEATVDRISYDEHELSKRAKDFGSAAVMFALVLCGLVWAGALWSRLLP